MQLLHMAKVDCCNSYQGSQVLQDFYVLSHNRFGSLTDSGDQFRARWDAPCNLMLTTAISSSSRTSELQISRR